MASSSDETKPLLSSKFHDALSVASRLHAHQSRKGGSIPYVSHLLGVCSIALRAGGSESQAIAALLHDALEDQGNKVSKRDIADQFGESVANIVSDCTDETQEQRGSIPWKKRKLDYLNHLQMMAADSRLVVLADKLDNIRDIKRELGIHGEQVWQKFTGKQDGMEWFHSQLQTIFNQWRQDFEERGHIDVVFLVDEFDRICQELHS